MSETAPRRPGRPRRTTPPPPRTRKPGDRHELLSGVALVDRRATLDDLHRQVEVLWGDRLTWQQIALLAGLPRWSLKLARQGRAMPEGTYASLRRLLAELRALVDVLPADIGVHEAPEMLGNPRLLAEERPAVEAAAKLADRLASKNL